MDTKIARLARSHLNELLLNLAPDGAPTPFIVAGGPHGVDRVELHPMSDPDFAQTAVTVIPAFIVLTEAVEVGLMSFTAGTPECVMLAHWAPRGRTLFVSEVTRRANHTPVLGRWVAGPVVASLGPIDDGVAHGRDMAQRIWNSDADELRARIDAIRAPAGITSTDTIPLTVNALREWGWLD